jgi:hypothetical protein
MSDSRDRHDSTEQRDTTAEHDDREQHDVTEQQDVTPLKTGGFGAFSKQYRDRWAANHPGSRRIHGDAASGSVTPIGAARTPPADAERRDTGGGAAKTP